MEKTQIKITIDKITWREGWKRFSIEACTHCNKIFSYCGISTVASCTKCLANMETQSKDDIIVDKLMELSKNN